MAKHRIGELEWIGSGGADKQGPLKDSMMLLKLLDIDCLRWGGKRSGGESRSWWWWWWWKGNPVMVLTVVEDWRRDRDGGFWGQENGEVSKIERDLRQQ